MAQQALAAAASDPATQLREVIVNATPDGSYTLPDASTGTKTDTPIMETPVSVQVVPQQVLVDQRSMSLEQAVANVSGVFTGGEEPGQEYFVIRGFTTTATLWNGFRIDEYSTVGGGTVGAVLMDNVEKIEVLKGPAGILYGRVEPGGMINAITKQPKEDFAGVAQLTLGSWRDEWAGIDLTGPLNGSATLLYRLNASEEHTGSWQWGAEARSLALAPVLEWKIAPDTRLSIEGQFRHEAGEGGVQAVPVDPATGQFAAVPMAYTPLTATSGFDQTRIYLHLTHEFDRDWSVSGKLLHAFTAVPVSESDYINAVYYPAIAPADLPMDRAVFLGASHNRTDATMLDVVGHFDALGARHTLLVGADGYYTPISQPILGYSCCYATNFYAPTPLPPGAALVPNGPFGYQISGENNQSSRDYGIYVQDQFALPSDVHVLVGERYQHYVETSASSGAIGAPLVSNPPTADHLFTPRLGLLWRPRRWLSVYYSFAENFGNNSGFAFPNVPLHSESSRQSEVGVKTEFGGGRLTSSLALYDLAKFNIAAGDPNHPGFDVDIGKVRSKGVEFDLQGELAEGWDAIANFSYTQPYVVIGAAGASAGPASETIVAGHLLEGVPEHLFNLWTTYRLRQPAWKGWKIGAGARWAASSSYPFTGLSTPAFWNDSLLASYQQKVGAATLTGQLNVDNLFNKFYYVNLYPVPSGNYTDINYGPPRQFRLTLRVDF